MNFARVLTHPTPISQDATGTSKNITKFLNYRTSYTALQISILIWMPHLYNKPHSSKAANTMDSIKPKPLLRLQIKIYLLPKVHLAADA